MTMLLEVYDQRPGAGKELSHRLELPSERITARELIRRRVEAELSDRNAVDDEAKQWLVRPGATERALNGERGSYGPHSRAINVDASVEQAFRAFERNGFFMIFDGRQVTDLDEVLTVERESALTFIRLTPLVGG